MNKAGGNRATRIGMHPSDARIAKALEVGVATVERVRKQFVTQGMKTAVEE